MCLYYTKNLLHSRNVLGPIMKLMQDVFAVIHYYMSIPASQV